MVSSMISIKDNIYLNELNKDKPLVLALSGGVDSMVLLNLLINEGFKIVIAHVNHHKRKESATEEAYIRGLENNSNIIVRVSDYHHEDKNFQALAHNMRYEFFYALAHEFDASAIITAHHAQDNLETIIMNIVRGSNLYGYAGIKELSYYQDVKMIRPLLHFDKDEIYLYAKENNITYFEDSSNGEDDYFRNRIRHHVIPLLKKENPNLYASIDNYSTQLFGAFNYIRGNSIAFMNKYNNKIDIDAFNKLDITLKKDIINYIFDENKIASSENKIDDILSLINNPKPNLYYDLGGGYRFVKAYDECYLTELLETPAVYEEVNLYDTVILKDYGNFYFRRNFNDSTKESIKISTSEKFPLIIRHREHGDRIVTTKGHKKLKDFLIDKKVPKDTRDNILVVTNALNEILWVVGYYKKACKDAEAISFVFEEKK